jgi:hypothetical protein
MTKQGIVTGYLKRKEEKKKKEKEIALHFIRIFFLQEIGENKLHQIKF